MADLRAGTGRVHPFIHDPSGSESPALWSEWRGHRKRFTLPARLTGLIAPSAARETAGVNRRGLMTAAEALATAPKILEKGRKRRLPVNDEPAAPCGMGSGSQHHCKMEEQR